MTTERFFSDSATYRSVMALFEIFAEIHDTRAQRIAAIKNCLPELLGRSLLVVEANRAKSDGVVYQTWGGSTAYPVILELMKSEQGKQILIIKSVCLTESTMHLHPSSNCGFLDMCYWRRLCRQVIAQPLTDYVWLGGGISDTDLLRSAARLFTALKSAISSLEDYYMALGKRISGPVQEPIVDGFPFITEYGSEKTKFTYLLLLDSNHQIVVPGHRPSAAPHLLSEHNLAPTLHYPSKDDNGSVKYGGRHMIVMDYVEMKPLSGTLSIAQSKEVRRSIDLLHENNFVFGDLRPPNILIEGDKAMLVDFDWCGEDGKAHYPADLNTFMGIDWHPDVGPDAFMAKEAKYKSPNYLIRWFYKDVQDLKHMCYGSWNDVHRGHRKVASMPLSGKACVMYGRRTVQVLEAFSTKTGEILMDNIQRRQPL